MIGSLKCACVDLEHDIVLSFRHSFCSRLLYTAIPARCYHGDKTIFDLLQYLADDCTSLFWNGLDVPTIEYILGLEG